MKRFSFALILALMFAACGKDTDSASGEGISGSVLTDSRDGRTYKTVTIGAQTWMAENLNYETASSYCYGDSPANCTKYGRLYTWAAAMDSAGTWSSNGKGCGYKKTCSPTYPVRGVCPEGWHLPSKNEWETLFAAVGGKLVAGSKLKSTSGWYKNGNGTDDFGFSALPAGYRYYIGRKNEHALKRIEQLRAGHRYNTERSSEDGSAGSNAYFWSSTESPNDNDENFWSSTEKPNYSDAYRMFLYFGGDQALLYGNYKNYGLSVRCLKD